MNALTIAEFDTMLADDMREFYDDPLGFVMYAFDWGKGDLEDWEGPDEWQTLFLETLGDAIKTRAPGDVIRMAVKTGKGPGKTSFIMWIIAGLIMRGVHVTVASFETDIKPIFVRKLRAVLMRKAEYTRAEKSELDWADGMIRRHMAFISHSPNDDDDALSIEDVLDLAKASVIRHGTRVLIIDPWNEIDHNRGADESETDYTGRAIRMVKRFAKQNDVACWMIAHPSKPWQGQGKARIPGLYDISGSANWANKADYGIAFGIKSREYWTTTIAVTKVRMGLPGRMGEIVIQFDPNTSQYNFYKPSELEDVA